MRLLNNTATYSVEIHDFLICKRQDVQTFSSAIIYAIHKNPEVKHKKICLVIYPLNLNIYSQVLTGPLKLTFHLAGRKQRKCPFYVDIFERTAHTHI